MNKAFEAAAAAYKVAPVLTHKQEVMRLYRRSLRLINSWAEDREVFNEEATRVREEFNANIHHKEPAKIARLMRETREKLAAYHHPDPYIVPYMPGGTLFMRNPSFEPEVLYPNGIPEGVSTRRINIDMSNLPEGEKYAQVFVDSANKQYWIDK